MQMPAPALPRNPVSAELEWMTAIVKSGVTPTARSGATETMSNRLPAETPASVVMETETASAASVRPGARDGVGVEGGGAVRWMEAELASRTGAAAPALCARRVGLGPSASAGDAANTTARTRSGSARDDDGTRGLGARTLHIAACTTAHDLKTGYAIMAG